ncbi:hypothetical protein A6302_02661 [Methylobrevis pamukkalensis]|uniref:Uncharacterized protein n=1 Tax=Methylobrevis pamukkalensis TaxID=1439726 RepID=A0A1E3H1I8_9HYPH|nr:hypothetical protein A6302_02661 [Methylobrevis pamukkalensis]
MSAYDDHNIFARILRGEIPCHKVHEDDDTLVFMDIMPQARAMRWWCRRRPRATCSMPIRPRSAG